MKKFFFLAVVLILSLAPAASATAPASAPKSTDEAQYIYYNQTFTLNPDGSQSARISFAQKIYTHTAMNSVYTERQIPYNPKYQKVVINSAYVVQSDGTRVEAPSNSITEFLPSEASKSLFYNNIRTVTIVHAGLDLGSTIYLDYTVVSSPDYLPELDVFTLLQQTSPIVEETVTIEAPANKKIRFCIREAGIGYTFSESTGRHASANAPAEEPLIAAPNSAVSGSSASSSTFNSLTFRLMNIPASSQDPASSILCGDIPYLTATTWTSNESALAYLARQIDTATSTWLSYNSLKFIEQAHANDTEATQSLQDNVNATVSTIPISLSLSAFRTRRPEAVLASASGTEFEKAFLTHLMMNVCEIPHTLVASYSVNASCDVLPLSAIDHIIVWSPALPQSVPYAAMKPLLPLASSSFSSNAPSGSSIADDIRAANAPENLTFIATVNVTPDAVLCDNLTGGKLINTSTTPIVVLPGSDEGFAHNNPYAQMAYASRTADILLPYSSVFESYDFTVNLTVVSNKPAATSSSATSSSATSSASSDSYDLYTEAMNSHQMPIAFNTQPVDIINQVGSVHQRIMTTSDGFHVTRSLRIEKQVITSDDFEAFHALMAEWYAMFQ